MGVLGLCSADFLAQSARTHYGPWAACRVGKAKRPEPEECELLATQHAVPFGRRLGVAVSGQALQKRGNLLATWPLYTKARPLWQQNGTAGTCYPRRPSEPWRRGKAPGARSARRPQAPTKAGPAYACGRTPELHGWKPCGRLADTTSCRALKGLWQMAEGFAAGNGNSRGSREARRRGRGSDCCVAYLLFRRVATKPGWPSGIPSVVKPQLRRGRGQKQRCNKLAASSPPPTRWSAALRGTMRQEAAWSPGQRAQRQATPQRSGPTPKGAKHAR